MEVCDKHKKEYQAYCYEDASLLCLDCMLDHSRSKNHRMESLKEASRKVALIIQHYLTTIQRAEKAFEPCAQRFTDFKLALETFQHRILQKVHFCQLKIIKQVNESFEALTTKLAKKFDEILEQGLKVDKHNKDGLSALQALTERMHKAIQSSSETTLIFKYHSMGLAKENVEGTIKKWAPGLDFPTQKAAMNEANFLTVELSKTIDKIKSEITYKNPTVTKKSQSFISFSKDYQSLNPSFVEENTPITPDVLKLMASDIQEAIAKNHDQLMFASSPRQTDRLEPPLAQGYKQPQFFSRRSVNQFEPVAFKQPNSFRRIGSFAKIGVSELKVDDKRRTQALNLSGPGEKALIIGGTKSKEFTLKIYDFCNGNFEHRKTNFPAIPKSGVVYFNGALFIFGGKINGKASDRVFRYSVMEREMSEVKGLSLSKKKYEFGYAEVVPGVVLLFGGKDELKFPTADIELLDLNQNVARVVGKMGQPKFGVFALRINPAFPLEDNGLAVTEEAEFEDNFIGATEVCAAEHDRLESNNVSFNVSRLDSRPSIMTQFKYSFEQNPCDLSGLGKKRFESDEHIDDDKEFERFDLLTMESPGLTALKCKDDYPDAKILVFGGQSLSRTLLNSVEMFNLTTGTCTLFGELREARKQCWATHTRAGLLVFGGKGVSRHMASIEAYRGRKFLVKAQMFQEKSAFRGILRGDEIMLLGGKCEKGALNTIETYQVCGEELKLIKRIQTIPSFANFEVIYQTDLGSVI